MVLRLTTKFQLTVAMIMLFLSCLNAFGQRPQVSQVGCRLIDQSRPSQFISYQGVGLSQSKSEVLLRLHNNTSCEIILETDDKDPIQLHSVTNAGGSTDDTNANVWIPLHYLVQDSRGWRAPIRAFGWGDSVFSYDLAAGKSALFTVALIHFKKRLNVVVPFKYGWEADAAIGMGVGGVVHRVYFLAEDLPKSPPGKNR